MYKRNNGSTEQEKYQNKFTAFITASIRNERKAYCADNAILAHGIVVYGLIMRDICFCDNVILVVINITSCHKISFQATFLGVFFT